MSNSSTVQNASVCVPILSTHSCVSKTWWLFQLFTHSILSHLARHHLYPFPVLHSTLRSAANCIMASLIEFPVTDTSVFYNAIEEAVSWNRAPVFITLKANVNGSVSVCFFPTAKTTEQRLALTTEPETWTKRVSAVVALSVLYTVYG